MSNRDHRNERRSRGGGLRERTQTRREATSDSIWARPEPGARRPRFSREVIADTAVRIADAEGLEAVSMRRVASELHSGTMTLYHYVQNKDELIALMFNAVVGEVLVPDDEFAGDWREAMTQIARRSRAVALRHPWLLEARPQGGLSPNVMRHVEQSLAAVADTGLEPERRMDIVAMVDDYTYGSLARPGGSHEGGPSEQEIAAFLSYVDEQLGTGDFPHTRATFGDESARAFFARQSSAEADEQRFERGLAALLDGIELSIEKRGKSRRRR
jgi:AcrR family transcriptional regulator